MPLHHRQQDGRPTSSSAWSTQLSQLDSLSSRTPSASSSHTSYPSTSTLRSSLRSCSGESSDSDWISRFDVVDVLGGEGEEGYGAGGAVGVYGHTGCINALSWSSDGSLLASGSDDTRICLWKVGQEPASSHPMQEHADEIVQSYSSLGMGLSAVIHTNHRANIFSVKFSPTSSNTLFSCAGDHEVRVFDLTTSAAIASSVTSTSPASGAIGQRHKQKTPYAREWTEYPGSASDTSAGALKRVFRCHRGRVKRIATEEYSDSVFLTCSEDGSVRQHDLRVGHSCQRRECPPPLCDYRPLGMGLYSLTTSPLRPDLFVVAGTSPYAYLHDRRMVPRNMAEEWGVPLNPTQLTQCVRRFGPPIPSSADEPEEEHEEHEEVDEAVGRPIPPGIAAARDRARRARNVRKRIDRDREAEGRHVTAAKLSVHNGRELLLTYSGGNVCLYDIFDEPEAVKPAVMQASSESRRISTAKVPNPEERSEFVASSTLADDRTLAPDQADGSSASYTPAGNASSTAPPPTAQEQGRIASPEQQEDDDEEESGGDEEDEASSGMGEFEDDSSDAEELEDDISDSDGPSEETTVPSVAAASSRIPLVRPRLQYSGHRNVDTVKDVNFGGGPNDSLVLSGSDDGNVFVYRKRTTELVGILHADESVVNVMTFHPRLPVLACSGIDNSVKLLAPTNKPEKRFSRMDKREEIMEKNRDASWTSDALSMPSSAIMRMLNRALEGSGEEGEPGQTRRIPISMLMQMAQEQRGEGGDEGECVVS